MCPFVLLMLLEAFEQWKLRMKTSLCSLTFKECGCIGVIGRLFFLIFLLVNNNNIVFSVSHTNINLRCLFFVDVRNYLYIISIYYFKSCWRRYNLYMRQVLVLFVFKWRPTPNRQPRIFSVGHQTWWKKCLWQADQQSDHLKIIVNFYFEVSNGHLIINTYLFRSLIEGENNLEG